MNTAKTIFNQLNNLQFSYGETLSLILEHNGKPISQLPTEDFVFPDNSVLRVTNNGIKILELLQE